MESDYGMKEELVHDYHTLQKLPVYLKLFINHITAYIVCFSGHRLRFMLNCALHSINDLDEKLLRIYTVNVKYKI